MTLLSIKINVAKSKEVTTGWSDLRKATGQKGCFANVDDNKWGRGVCFMKSKKEASCTVNV
jgi:hypothetical protein